MSKEKRGKVSDAKLHYLIAVAATGFLVVTLCRKS